MHQGKIFNDPPTTKQVHTVSTILSKLQSDLSVSERKAFLEELSKSVNTRALLTSVDPTWRMDLLKQLVEIEKIKEGIRMYSIWNKNKLEAEIGDEHKLVCQKLDNFITLAKNPDRSEEYQKQRNEIAAIFGEFAIQAICNRTDRLLQLESVLTSQQEKVLLTEKLIKEVVPAQILELKHSLGFFSFEEKTEENRKNLDVDITDEDMASSVFGQGSNTASQ